MPSIVVPTPVQQLAAVYLAVVGIFAAFLLMLTPAFHGGSPDYPVWNVVNWFMMVSMPILLWANWSRKSSLGEDGSAAVTREYFAANLAFYTTVGLTIIFFWQFFFGRFPESETGLAVNSHVIHYPMMDTIFALVAVHAAHYLWRKPAGEQG